MGLSRSENNSSSQGSSLWASPWKPSWSSMWKAPQWRPHRIQSSASQYWSEVCWPHRGRHCFIRDCLKFYRHCLMGHEGKVQIYLYFFQNYTFTDRAGLIIWHTWHFPGKPIHFWASGHFKGPLHTDSIPFNHSTWHSLRCASLVRKNWQTGGAEKLRENHKKNISRTSN